MHSQVNLCAVYCGLIAPSLVDLHIHCLAGETHHCHLALLQMTLHYTAIICPLKDMNVNMTVYGVYCFKLFPEHLSSFSYCHETKLQYLHMLSSLTVWL